MNITAKSSAQGEQIFGIISELMESFRLLLPVLNILKKEDEPVRTGGYFRLWQRLEEEGRYIEVATMSVGELGVRLPDYLRFSHEKAQRLSELRGHVSSWQSRNEAAEMYGGAICAGPFILSFSGLPERWDEVFMLLIARRCGLIGSDQEEAILQISKNHPTLALLQ